MMKKNKKAVVLGGGGHFGIAWELEIGRAHV